MLNDALCYRAIQNHDARFDGAFVTAVLTTGIYCRPSCRAVTPKRENVRFYRTAAAAQSAGFRACKRCRPDAAPGSPDWNLRADLVGRAMREIADGVVDREGVAGLARRLGYSARQIHRQLLAEVGAGPLSLARAHRTETARMLLEGTDLPVTDVAFAAGFTSIRQFNETIRAVFSATPSEVRRHRSPAPAAGDALDPQRIRLRLPFRPPLDLTGILHFLAVRAVPGVEEFRDGRYRRVLSLAHGTAIAALGPEGSGPNDASSHVVLDLEISDLRDLGSALERCRRLLDLDADPFAVLDVLGGDPLLGASAAENPGRRVPGHVHGEELALRAVLGQQVSVRGARTLAARLTARYGRPLIQPVGSLTHAFPSAAALADADPADLAMPEARKRAFLSLARALASGAVRIDPGVDRDELERTLATLPGIGPWTVSYIRMRALGDPDAFLPTDLGVRHALEKLGVDGRPGQALRLSERWRPYRAYALQHLWAQLDGEAVNGGSRRETENAGEG